MEVDVLNNEVKDIRRTLAWMDLVLANISEAVFVVDTNWKMTFLNDTFMELVGGTRILLLGSQLWNTLPLTQDSRTIKDQIDAQKFDLKNIESINGLYKLDLFKTSRILYLRCSYIPNLNQAACVLSDVTVETRATEKLRQLGEK